MESIKGTEMSGKRGMVDKLGVGWGGEKVKEEGEKKINIKKRVGGNFKLNCVNVRSKKEGGKGGFLAIWGEGWGRSVYCGEVGGRV